METNSESREKPPVLTYVEKRLIEWAEWFSWGNAYGLGYSSCSIEYRLMTEGVMTKYTGFKPIACNEAAEEIEALVVEMADQNFSMANALRGYYFMGGSLRSKAKCLKISHTQLKYAVDMAHQWLAGRLSANKSIY
jgi:hypothetical protein